mgnify:CR=1 FL=1
MARVSVDTSVIVEYIDEEGEFHEQAEAVFSAILSGRLEAVVPHPVLAETYYVAARLYQELGVDGAEATAAELVEWLYRLPTVTVVGADLDLALEAGKVKLRYGLALTDCYVIAASKVYGCTALFKKPEAEMLRSIEQLRRDYRIVFLAEYK